MVTNGTVVVVAGLLTEPHTFDRRGQGPRVLGKTGVILPPTGSSCLSVSFE